MNGCNQPIATARQGLDETRVVATIPERSAHLREAVRQAAVKIDVCLIPPDGFAQILFAYDLVRESQKHRERASRLWLQWRRAAILAEQIRGRVKLERAESIGHGGLAILADFDL